MGNRNLHSWVFVLLPLGIGAPIHLRAEPICDARIIIVDRDGKERPYRIDNMMHLHTEPKLSVPRSKLKGLSATGLECGAYKVDLHPLDNRVSWRHCKDDPMTAVLDVSNLSSRLHVIQASHSRCNTGEGSFFPYVFRVESVPPGPERWCQFHPTFDTQVGRSVRVDAPMEESGVCRTDRLHGGLYILSVHDKSGRVYGAVPVKVPVWIDYRGEIVVAFPR